MSDDDFRQQCRDLIDEIRADAAHLDWHEAMAKDTHNEQAPERRHWLRSLLEGMNE